MLLNNVQLQGLRGRGGPSRWPDECRRHRREVRGAPPPPGRPRAAAARRLATGEGIALSAAAAGRPVRVRTTRASATAAAAVASVAPPQPPRSTGPPAPSAQVPAVPAAPAVGATPAPAPTPGTATVDAGQAKLMIDLAPIRREMFRQIVPEGRPEALTAEERQRIAEEVNQRMLGIVQGIQLGAKELQKARRRSGAGGRGARPKPPEAKRRQPPVAAPPRVGRELLRASGASGRRVRRTARPRLPRRRPQRRRRATRRRPPSASRR